MAATTRTTEGLRSTLFDTLDMFMTGKIDATTARTTAKLADSILKSALIDIEYKRFIHQVETSRGPKALADMNLNVVLSREKSAIESIADVRATP